MAASEVWRICRSGHYFGRLFRAVADHEGASSRLGGQAVWRSMVDERTEDEKVCGRQCAVVCSAAPCAPSAGVAKRAPRRHQHHKQNGWQHNMAGGNVAEVGRRQRHWQAGRQVVAAAGWNSGKVGAKGWRGNKQTPERPPCEQKGSMRVRHLPRKVGGSAAVCGQK